MSCNFYCLCSLKKKKKICFAWHYPIFPQRFDYNDGICRKHQLGSQTAEGMALNEEHIIHCMFGHTHYCLLEAVIVKGYFWQASHGWCRHNL